MVYELQKFTKNLWMAIVSGGIVSIIFGLVAMLWPHVTLSFFIYLFSIFVLAISVIVLGQAFTNIKVDRLWWLSMLFAICGISIGLFILVNPSVAQAFIAVLLAVYIFTQSLLDLVVASYSGDRQSKLPVTIIGIFGVIFGFLVLLYPKLATEALVWVIGLYILIHGIAIEYYAIRVRRTAKRLTKALDSSSSDSKRTARKGRRSTSKARKGSK